jgi:hypothetical protein
VLRRLQLVASRLQPLRPASLVGVFAFLALGAWAVLVGGEVGNRWVIPALVGLVWSLSLFALLTAFASLPPAPDPAQGFFRRLRLRLARLYYWALALVFILATLVSVYLSYKLTIVWVADHG